MERRTPVKRTTTLEKLLTAAHGIAIVTLGLAICASAATAQPSPAQAADCDRQCLVCHH